VGRKNYLFCGSDAGGERAAAIYGLIGRTRSREYGKPWSAADLKESCGQVTPASNHHNVQLDSTIDICINNGIIGVQKENAYAQTKGKRRPIGRPAQASLGLAGFWSFSQRRGTTNWIECQFGYALAGCLAAGWSEGFEGAFLSRPPLEAGRKTT
jgi:hypothetical protein